MASIGAAGGDKLQKVLREIALRVGKETTVQVGFQDGATYPAVDGANPVYVAQVAFWNEYGTSRTPARPFFRTMIARKSDKWGDNVARVLKANNYDVTRTLSLTGEKIIDQLRDSIINGGWQPNSDATIAKKGFDKPLQHTELMVRSITSVIV